MAENSNIEWCDHTFNPWEGCMAVAPECDNCYAEARDARYTGGKHWGPKAPRRRTSVQTWNKARKWNREADAFFAQHGRRQRVFCASLADVFDNAVDPAWRADLWELIRECDHLDWLLLTKRPQNITKMLPEDWGDGWAHVWLGTSAGCQESADKNIPPLLGVPAAKRFLSCEPLLGPVHLLVTDKRGHDISSLRGLAVDPTSVESADEVYRTGKIHWVISGGESGPKARPMHPDWARSLRDQCQAAGVPYFFKQWGEWLPWHDHGWPEWMSQAGAIEDRHTLFPSDFDVDRKWDDGMWTIPKYEHCVFQRVGKKAAGRLLDGTEWNEVPA